jgi:RNA polymerase sigma-70 factor (ECF subfamily)
MLGRSREAAEDLLQQIFIKLSRAGDYYEPRAKFSTWLFAIVRNHCLNHLRSQKYLMTKHTASIDAEENTVAMETALSIGGDCSRVDRNENIEIVERAISSLPEKYREAFLLHAVEGFTHQEISAILQVKPATVRTHYHRARRMLRDAIGAILNQ